MSRANLWLGCLTLILAACSLPVRPVQPPPTSSIERCMPRGSATGRLTEFEYANFWPVTCPGIAFGVRRFSSEKVSNAAIVLMHPDPEFGAISDCVTIGFLPDGRTSITISRIEKSSGCSGREYKAKLRF